MKLPKIDPHSFAIFWEESLSIILIFAAYAFAASGVILFCEYRFQLCSVGVGSLLISNAVTFVAAVLLFTICFYISGWMSDLILGETFTTIVVASISVGLLFLLKQHFIDYFGLQFESSVAICLVASFSLLAPYLLFYVFMCMIGAAFKN